MDKESVLEIEFQPIFDKWGWRVIKQDVNILKRGIFRDNEIEVYSTYFPDFYEGKFLYIRGSSEYKDNRITLCTSDEKKLIEEKVKAINEKYGIKRRWRAEKYDNYHFLGSIFEVCEAVEMRFVEDIERYKDGNYFKTKEEAEDYAKYMIKCSLEWHKNKEDDNDE